MVFSVPGVKSVCADVVVLGQMYNNLPIQLHMVMLYYQVLTKENCVCVFGFNVAFNNFSVISQRCLVATGSSMLTFIVLPH